MSTRAAARIYMSEGDRKSPRIGIQTARDVCKQGAVIWQIKQRMRCCLPGNQGSHGGVENFGCEMIKAASTRW